LSIAIIPFNQINSISSLFLKTFHTSLKEYVDPMLSTMIGDIFFDIVKFDDYLVSNFGYNIDIDGSQSDFITRTFGKEANDLITSLI